MIFDLRSHFLAMAASLAILISVCPAAQSTTYTCTAVDKKALLGISSSASVSVSSQDKTCTFSVDGESPTGKQSPEFVNAMNQVLSGSINSSTLSPEMFAALLVGPFLADGQASSISSSFRNSFGTSIRDVQECLRNFHQNFDSSPTSGISRDNLVCRVLVRPPSGGNVGTVSSFGAIEIQVSEPTLQLAIVFEQRSFSLFIPARLIAAGVRGYRLGR